MDEPHDETVETPIVGRASSGRRHSTSVLVRVSIGVFCAGYASGHWVPDRNEAQRVANLADCRVLVAECSTDAFWNSVANGHPQTRPRTSSKTYATWDECNRDLNACDEDLQRERNAPKVTPPVDPGPVTESNWQSHPTIVEARQLYQEIHSAVSSRSWRTQSKQAGDCPHAIARDLDGFVRYYRRWDGTGDQGNTIEHYYDPSGRLRFAFVRASASNETVEEYRVYFDSSGNRIWHIHKRVAGPGYFFPDVWPDDDLVKSDPSRVFATAKTCVTPG